MAKKKSSRTLLKGKKCPLCKKRVYRSEIEGKQPIIACEDLTCRYVTLANLPMKKIVTSDECGACGKGPLLHKTGRYGPFLACPDWPDECRFTRRAKMETGIKCPSPDCNGFVIKKWAPKARRYFYGCDQYPNCEWKSWSKPAGEDCPKCGLFTVEVWHREEKRVTEIICAALDKANSKIVKERRTCDWKRPVDEEEARSRASRPE